MNTTKKYSPEVRERAVRLVFEHEAEHESQWAAIESIAAKIPSARPTCPSPGNPHGCWISYSRFTVNSKIDLTVDFNREFSATFFLSLDLPSD